jgi:hypothetical protein
LVFVVAKQAIPERKLPTATIEFPEAFARITSVHELRDGRVLVVSARENVVRLLDVERGVATPVGGWGEDLGQYKTPRRLIPYGNDSTLLTDPGQKRSIVIGPDGVAGGVLLLNTPPSGAASGAKVPAAADGIGRLYFHSTVIDSAGSPAVPDSVPLLRFDPSDRRLDTLTWLKVQRPNVRIERANGKIAKIEVGGDSWVEHDDWGVFPDGHVVVVRGREYHLDIVTPSGQITSGPRVPYNPVLVTEADRQAIPEWARAQLPRFKPPFVGSSVLTAPDGRIWVKRTGETTDSSARYDVLDVSGRLVTIVVLPPWNQLAGFGRASLYLIRRDSLGTEHLGRLPFTRF